MGTNIRLEAQWKSFSLERVSELVMDGLALSAEGRRGSVEVTAHAGSDTAQPNSGKLSR